MKNVAFPVIIAAAIIGVSGCVYEVHEGEDIVDESDSLAEESMEGAVVEPTEDVALPDEEGCLFDPNNDPLAQPTETSLKGCSYVFTGLTYCRFHTLMGTFCPSGPWYCYVADCYDAGIGCC